MGWQSGLRRHTAAGQRREGAVGEGVAQAVDAEGDRSAARLDGGRPGNSLRWGEFEVPSIFFKSKIVLKNTAGGQEQWPERKILSGAYWKNP